MIERTLDEPEDRELKRARAADTLSLLLLAELSGIPLPPGGVLQSQIDEATEYLRNVVREAKSKGNYFGRASKSTCYQP